MGSNEVDTDPVATIVEGYFRDMRDAVVVRQGVEGAVSRIVKALAGGDRVLLAGNGGSALTASHLASDWGRVASKNFAHPLVVSLSDNAATVLGLANDIGYDDIFALQLERLGRPNDIFVALSVSSRSQNLVRAADVARRIGMSVVVFGGTVGPLTDRADFPVMIGGADYGITEDLHLAIGHLVVRVLRKGRPETVSSR